MNVFFQLSNTNQSLYTVNFQRFSVNYEYLLIIRIFHVLSDDLAFICNYKMCWTYIYKKKNLSN